MTIEIYADDVTKASESTAYENLKLYEEINGAYAASFDVSLYEFEKFKSDAYISGLQAFFIINGQKYTPATVRKDRGDSAIISIDVEHVSYTANNIFVYSYLDEKMTGTVAEIFGELVTAVDVFNVDTVEFYEEIEFRPREGNSLREMLIELARGVGGELYWDNYSVSLLQRRGADKGLELETGVNIERMSAFFDRSKSGEYWSYDVDFIDLAYVPGYEQFANVELGDTVRLIDADLGIDTTERIVSIERDPFNKALPKVQIGRIVPNLFNYQDDEKEDDGDGAENTESLSLNFELEMDFETTLSGDLEEEDDGTGGLLKKNNVWTEWATVPFASFVTINFSKHYRQKPSVNVHVYGGTNDNPVVTILEGQLNGLTVYTGVTISSSSGDEITMHAIGRV